ncbi:alpha/beta hydrolase [Ralstonia pickettii]|jgi:pimeloyl-ACP methyl ester carboxylesterase|nr:hypothetical protein AC240_05050 [Ralstonia sp. MD27]MBA9854881.1 alpha/beta hydrolase [Ralstonia insidiosa]MBX3770722.1 alpha/beta hydrolase [Ralstonia pickettii]MCP4212044.1 alpha/beta hydrolase [Halieaceae bacterium]NOZ16230.1 alpha/beta hydrolase [Betaproteobacteria bacterium]
MPRIKLVDQSMYYMDRGEGRTIVLLHSYLANAFMWTPQVQALEAHYRVIVPDLWGHGSSGPLPKGTEGLAALTRQLQQLLDSLEVERYVLVGQSIGGMLAAELASISPARAEGVVLIGTHLGAEPAGPQAYFLDMLDRLEASGAFSPALLDEAVSLFFRGSASTTASLKASFRKQLSSRSAEALRESIIPIGRMIFQRVDRRSLLDGLAAASTLVMCGEHDSVRPPSESREMAERIGCRYVEVPDASHTSNLEQPEFVTQALLSFLAKLDRR